MKETPSKDERMSPRLKKLIHDARLYLAEQREYRAFAPTRFDQEGFSAIYQALNQLGYLDKEAL